MTTYGVDRSGAAGGNGSAVTPVDAAVVTAKGDLIVGTASGAVDNLAAGTNEKRLVADSAEPTGLKYVADTVNYAVAAKGDLLAGTAADTVAPVTVGANDTFLIADSAQAPGVKWGTANSFTEDTTPDPTADYVPTYDASAAATKKILLGRAGAITLRAEQASTSGTSIDFTSLPAGVKEVKIMLHGVSGDGAGNLLVQIGDSGGLETTVYVSHAMRFNNAPAITNATATDGFVLGAGMAAASLHNGVVTLSLQDSTNNTWLETGLLNDGAGAEQYLSSGVKSLSAALDRVRLTFVGGAVVFDAGAVSISYKF